MGIILDDSKIALSRYKKKASIPLMFNHLNWISSHFVDVLKLLLEILFEIFWAQASLSLFWSLNKFKKVRDDDKQHLKQRHIKPNSQYQDYIDVGERVINIMILSSTF